MYKKMAAIVVVLLILCSATAWAQQKTVRTDTASKMTTGASASSMYAKALPDLTVTSARITSAPFQIGPNVLVPLQIKIKNIGSTDVIEDFFVSSYGGDTDDNVQGYWMGGSGVVVEQDSIVVSGLAAGAEKTINCYLMLAPIRSQPSSGEYWVDVEVDGTGDPDFAGNVIESDENNNVLKANYPWAVPAGGMMATTPFQRS